MKIIDLLNKIANGKEVPKKIKYKNCIYTIRDDKDDYVNNGDWFTNSYDYLELNDEIEIIEEKKIPEKITMRAGIVGSIDSKIENLDINTMAVEDKINEIIDYLKSKGK